MSPQEDGAGSGATGVTVFDVYGARPEPRSVRRLPRLVLDALRLVWAAGRQDVIVLVVLQTAAGLGIALPVLVGRQLLDELFSTGDLAELTGLLPQVGVLVAVTVALGAAQAVAQERDQILTEVVSLHVQRRILDITAGLDLLHFDTAELYDRLQRASFGAQFGPFHLVRGLVQLVGAVFGVLGATIALVILEPLLVPVAILAGVPLWVASLRRGRLYWEFITRFTPAERERGYVQGLLGERSAAKEVRAFALAQPLRARWDRLSGERLDELRVVVRRQLRLALLGDLASAALLGGALLLLTALLLSGRLSVAEAGAGAAALLLLGERLRGAAGGADILFEAAPFMRDLAAFLGIERELEPPGTRPSAPAGFSRMEVRNLTFSYPGAPGPAVRDVSMELAAGEVVALVGENGSGKTTLAKVLSGLYAPQDGHVLWGGVDTATLSPESVRAQVAVLFQDFLCYLLPARDNVGLGRHERAHDLEAVVQAARHAGADPFLSGLRQGYDTILGPQFDGGTDLSVGQWQRVALARAFFRDAPLVILDEPTAALDARAEHELFASMRTLFQGRTVVLISHRFSSVRSADRTYVLHEGQIVESGSHEELMALGGRYAELYTLQAEAYREVGIP